MSIVPQPMSASAIPWAKMFQEDHADRRRHLAVLVNMSANQTNRRHESPDKSLPKKLNFTHADSRFRPINDFTELSASGTFCDVRSLSFYFSLNSRGAWTARGCFSPIPNFPGRARRSITLRFSYRICASTVCIMVCPSSNSLGVSAEDYYLFWVHRIISVCPPVHLRR